MKEKILNIINNLKLKLLSNKKLADFIEKFQNIINDIKLKLQSNKIIAGLLEKIQIFIIKFRKKQKTDSEKSNKLKRVWQRRFKKIFSLKSITSVIAILISIPAILFYVYAFIENNDSKTIDEKSVNRIINSNLNYATVYLIKELKYRRIQKKQLRGLIKQLNGVDSYGNMHKFAPCKEYRELMFGETPAPGNVVIWKPTGYEFEITSYNCTLEPLLTKTIKLKIPPKAPKKASKKKKPDLKTAKEKNLKDIQNDTKNNVKPETNTQKASDKSTQHKTEKDAEIKDKKTPLEPVESKNLKINPINKDTHIESNPVINDTKADTKPKTKSETNNTHH